MPKQNESWEGNKNNPLNTVNLRSNLLALLRSTRASLLVIVSAVVLCLFYTTCTTYIGPGEFGIKQVLYSPFGLFGPMGTQKVVYETGIHHQFPTMEKILRFPKTIQVLTMRDAEITSKEAENMTATDQRYTRIVKAAYIQ